MVSLNDVLLAMSNIPVDDPIAETWGRGLQGGYKIIEYTGSLPIIINANGDALIDYRIYGADWGVGESTENLIRQVSTTQRVYLANQKYCLSKYVSVPTTGNKVGIVVYDANDVIIFNDYIGVWKSLTYDNTSGQGAYADITISYLYGGVNASFVVGASPNTSVPYPANYIPYGYKLPMTVGDGNTAQTVPVYIGENQLDSVESISDYVDKSSGKIVRMIGEYTFTGDESFNKYGNSDVFYTSSTIDPVGITTVNTITMRCNHPAFTAIENKDTRYWLNPESDNVCCFLPGGMSQVFLRSTSNFTTVAECQAYLKSQYDNGTPVKISYWLKTPVEEDPPVLLPDIPTIEGETIIDYDGTPKPSQMYVKYKGKG